MVVDPGALVRNAINLYEAVWVRFLFKHRFDYCQ